MQPFPFSFWQQTSNSPNSYFFNDATLSSFSTCQTNVKSQILSSTLGDTEPDTVIILRYLVNRLSDVSNISSQTDFSPYGSTSNPYDITFTLSGTPQYTITISGDESGTWSLDFIDNDAAVESYIQLYR
jgi:hypothetical protein